jgi:hydrogenase maturation protease
VAPVLVVAIGNPSRGDDALGPLAAERLQALEVPGVEVMTDFQLQVEHALDVRGRSRVLFIDASAAIAEPFELVRVEPRRDESWSTHALAPGAVLRTCADLFGAPPDAWLLAIRGESFELGSGLSAAGQASLQAALGAAEAWVRNGAAAEAR